MIHLFADMAFASFFAGSAVFVHVGATAMTVTAIATAQADKVNWLDLLCLICCDIVNLQVEAGGSTHAAIARAA
ncbi:hypothetical protein C1X43_20625 [Pseudomonas sp. GW460-C3]|nr:hypothetical protein C1X43_20625 [Pseudomonas sp. GW460-C3]PMY19021.1 hypothetical protein C1X54_19775 [Pseudomonas sp. GW460-13]